ncbi:hypothetical protein AYI92_15065 [Shewanella xiamenensis]|nr:hypothetical protein AYI90_14930 [Shewanella xiamenensis]TVL16739.1 hypothetical protein AYI91_14670 [Shewanella xiamenensis]TVL24202.1 hypothetical protein AYI92_15065 [Shewanella xiamenensis]TVL30399.1 hypothetical protein AYI93_14825 [Shewanella xiamenensis]TVP00026.1 hypothetical protein AYI89_14995 [Shewanella xiamenensis]
MRFLKMLIRYLYIDDDHQNDIQPLINELEHFGEGKVQIEHIRVRTMKEIVRKFSSDKFDGLIIDQKLDAANEYGNTADYWGTSLAQNFRTEMIGREIDSAPIILLSNEDVFVQYYDLDESAHNLFDYAVKKRNVASSSEYACKVSKIIIALAIAYKHAREDVLPNIATLYSKPFELLEPLLKWDEAVFKYTDNRFVEYIQTKSHDIHTLISLLLNNFVYSAGILITEEMLATKLGVDISRSADWERLKGLLNGYKYQGVFSELKERWWFSRIEDWWLENYPEGQVLRAMKASERVDALKKFTLLTDINAIIPKYSNGKQSEKFWVNCIVSGTPLDPYDALIAKAVDLKPWEQKIYLDVETVYNRRHTPKFSVDHDYQKKVKPLYKRLTSDE